MRARRWAIGIGGSDCLAGAAIASVLLLSSSDPATKGLDSVAGGFVALLLLVTGVPALALAWTGRAPKTSLAFALAFPVCFILIFIGVVIAYAF
jgi:hypothetical protein